MDMLVSYMKYLLCELFSVKNGKMVPVDEKEVAPTIRVSHPTAKTFSAKRNTVISKQNIKNSCPLGLDQPGRNPELCSAQSCDHPICVEERDFRRQVSIRKSSEHDPETGDDMFPILLVANAYALSNTNDSSKFTRSGGTFGGAGANGSWDDRGEKLDYSKSNLPTPEFTVIEPAVYSEPERSTFTPTVVETSYTPEPERERSSYSSSDYSSSSYDSSSSDSSSSSSSSE